MGTSLLFRLAPELRRQFGTFTTRQARDRGVGGPRLTELLRAGEIERLYRSVYGSLLYPDGADRRWMAAQLAGGEHTVISHRAAAHLHGLTYTRTGRRPDLEMSVRRGSRRFSSTVRIHTQVPFRPSDVVEVGVWRVTSVAWTLSSLAHDLGAGHTERAVGAAMAAGKLSIEQVAACVPRFRFCAGVQILRDLLHRLSPELRLTRSEAERLVLRLVREAGLPEPEVNLRVVDAAGRVRELDLAWPEFGVCVEIDVHPSHDGTIGRHRDGRRQNDLIDDWRVLRFDDLDLQFDAPTVVGTIRRSLARAGADI
ncbi:MAG: type IV toxin-antitoxin system AbiEi family antitoxin domain-containing protein [Actinobacteria bacterium]|nr:type IV toxin-antitoxin system AbiEi family antitoxin domain-containing protein [Actinomycetota bacterium]